MNDPLAHGWWLASRSAGIVAYLLLSASVLLGLAMALRVAPPRMRPALRLAHERVALLSLAATAAHGLTLLGDSWLHIGVIGALVPFVDRYRPLWTGIGILAAYMATALSLSYYARRRIGPRRWRSAHRLIPIAWAMAAVHTIGAGSDAGSVWLALPLGLTIVLAGAMLGYRLLGPRTHGAPAGAGATAAATRS